MKFIFTALQCLLLFVCLTHSLSDSSLLFDRELKLATFNIQSFGQTKMSKPDVVEVLRKILARYDLVAIQEIRDKTDKSIKNLLSEVNRESPFADYDMVVSSRLGETQFKEQYVFFYRKTVLQHVSSYQFESNETTFKRPPFAAQFQFTDRNRTLTLSNIHISPMDAKVELENLYIAHKMIRQQLPADLHFIAGDFNSDCTYIRARQLAEQSLKKSGEYLWFVKKCVQSTMLKSACVYDHILLYQAQSTVPHWWKQLSREAAETFPFHLNYSLDFDWAGNVSDHLPVEVFLQGEAKDSLTQATMSTDFQIQFHGRQPSKTKVKSFHQKCRQGAAVSKKLSHWVTSFDAFLNQSAVHATVNSVNEAVSQLESFIKEFPQLIFPEHISLLQYAVSKFQKASEEMLLGEKVGIICHADFDASCDVTFRVLNE